MTTPLRQRRWFVNLRIEQLLAGATDITMANDLFLLNLCEYEGTDDVFTDNSR
ncbi:hypothetical protein OH492_17870 [Vibrio chagasii]|nr:hypothetical protein [Vibrio chagasii]